MPPESSSHEIRSKCGFLKFHLRSHDILNETFKISANKPIPVDLRRRACLPPESSSHEIRSKCGFLKFHLRTHTFHDKNRTVCDKNGTIFFCVVEYLCKICHCARCKCVGRKTNAVTLTKSQVKIKGRFIYVIYQHE